jgi:predicted Fe-S protein YdhL (DUF1289 family)
MESPCIKVCEIVDGICKGCYRSLEEITDWTTMTDDARSVICSRHSDQSVFDFVLAHLRKQNKAALAPDGYRCVYKNGDLKCAVGCLIPDRQYDKSIEGSAVVEGSLIGNLLSRLGYKNLPLLSAMQEVHDNWGADRPWGAGEDKEFNDIAIVFGLKMELK